MPQAVIWCEGNAITRTGKRLAVQVCHKHKQCHITSCDIDRGKGLHRLPIYVCACDVGIEHIISMSEREVCYSVALSWIAWIGKRPYVRANVGGRINGK